MDLRITSFSFQKNYQKTFIVFAWFCLLSIHSYSQPFAYIHQKDIDGADEIVVDLGGNVWVGSNGNGIYRFDATNWQLFSVADGLTSNYVNDIAVDGNNNVWIATQDGVTQFDGNNFIPHEVISGLGYDVNIDHICTDASNNIWVTYGNSFYKYDGITWELKFDNSNQSITCDGNNDLWFINRHYIYQYDGNSIIHHENINIGLTPYPTFTNIISTDDNKIWVCTHDTLACYSQNTWEIFDLNPQRDLNFSVSNIYPGSNGSVWIQIREDYLTPEKKWLYKFSGDQLSEAYHFPFISYNSSACFFNDEVWISSLWDNAVYKGVIADATISIQPEIQYVSRQAGTIIPFEIVIGEPDEVISPDNFYSAAFKFKSNIEYNRLSEEIEIHDFLPGDMLGNNPIVFQQEFLYDEFELTVGRTDGMGQTGTGTLLNGEFEIIETLTAYETETTIFLSLSSVTAIQEDGSELYLAVNNSAQIKFGTEVWPGDADNNSQVDMNDLLPIAAYYNELGIERSNEFKGIEWDAKFAEEWISNYNATYADCNGDGVVNYIDVLAICLNYNKSHMKKSNQKEKEILSPSGEKPLLSIRLFDENMHPVQNDDLHIGDTFYLGLNIENVANNQILGVAFSMNWENENFIQVLNSNESPQIDIGNVWDANPMSLGKAYNTHLEYAIANTDRKMLQNDGEIMFVKMRVNDFQGEVKLNELKIVDIQGNIIEAGHQDLAINMATSIADDETNESVLSVYPNPCHNQTQFKFSLKTNTQADLKIYTISNKLIDVVFENKSFIPGQYSFLWETSHLEAGIYLYQFKTETNISLGKILISD